MYAATPLQRSDLAPIAVFFQQDSIRSPRGKTINLRLIELETAKQILEEIFHDRPSDVDDMIHRRLEEKNCSEAWCE